MACQEVNDWIERVGPVAAAEQINAYLTARGYQTISYQAVQQWVGRDVPDDKVLAVEFACGCSRHDINPRLYPKDESLLGVGI